MKYQPLFHIAIRHTYYPDLRCPDFIISPDENGAAFIRMHRLLVGHYANGISVLIPTIEDKPLMTDLELAVFSFQLKLKNLQFYEFTVLPALRTPIVFENNQRSHNLKLNTKQQNQINQSGEPVFGLIRIRNISFKKAAPVFSLQWTSKKLFWKYLLVTDEDSPGNFRIEQSRTTGKEKKIEFKTPGAVSGKKNGALLKLLDKDYPDAKKVMMESKEAVTLFKGGRKNIQLKKDNLVLVDHLPNPRPEEGGLKVIKYLKNKKN